jgi:UDP-glucose 4-epimerase
MAAGEETKIYGDGRQTRDFVEVADVVRAVMAAAGSGGVFNVGSGAETSVLELHEHCRTVAGDSREPELAPAREGDLLRSVLDISLAAREIGWHPEVSLDEGLRQTWEWVRSEEGGRATGTK